MHEHFGKGLNCPVCPHPCCGPDSA